MKPKQNINLAELIRGNHKATSLMPKEAKKSRHELEPDIFLHIFREKSL